MVILPIGGLFGSGLRHKQIKRYVCRRTELLYRFAFSCEVGWASGARRSPPSLFLNDRGERLREVEPSDVY